MKRYIILLVAIFAVSFSQAADKKPVMKRVYLFAFSASFTDSTAYMTDIQTIDSAYVWDNHFLADRALYSLQLDNYLEGTLHKMNNTTVVFFDEKKSKLEDKYLKVRKRYRDGQNLHIIFLGVDQFKFKAEEWMEPYVEDASDVKKEDKKAEDKAGQPDTKGIAAPGVPAVMGGGTR